MNYNKNLQGFIFIIIHYCKYIIIANLSIQFKATIYMITYNKGLY